LSSNDEWVTDEEEETPFESTFTKSLFDNHESASFEENVQYMNHQFSFFVPQAQCLTNPHGLFSYLQEKIDRYHICICCHRIFNSVHACKRHMLDAAHCKFNVDQDVTAQEFYTLKQQESVIVNGQLKLKSGALVGHRDMHRYYKQNVPIENQRVAVVANRRSQFQKRVLRMGSKGALHGKLLLRAERKARQGILTKSSALFKGTSKAIASTYVYKPSAADNKRTRAIVHHAGSHFHMAGTRQFHRGVRVKGIKMRGRHGSKLSSAMVRQRVKQGNSSSNRGNRRFDHRRG
jgi:pre-60S factor REI1